MGRSFSTESIRFGTVIACKAHLRLVVEFEEHGVIDRATGERFRHEFLAVGASRPALESFIAFRGRHPEPEALLRSYGLA